MSAKSLTISDLNHEITPNEPRIQDLRLGVRLGFERARDIRKIIERNEVELEAYGSLAPQRRKSRGQPFTEYHLNEAQALLICMFARTDKAAQVRKEVIAVYLALRGATIKPQYPLTQEQRLKIENAVSATVYASLSDEIKTRFDYTWEQIHQHFGVEHHREIKQDQLDDLLKCIDSITPSSALPAPRRETFGVLHLTPAQLSDRWGGQVKPSTLANWRHKKVGPTYVKLCGTVMYRLTDIEKWEYAQQIQTQIGGR
ncbi:hypothetical protein [Nitrincola sp.]|uniref:hypothetical protein n=1 Tax=Nitrincola sp. TaxID=1926584 RepID=UPI003A92C90D